MDETIVEPEPVLEVVSEPEPVQEPIAAPEPEPVAEVKPEPEPEPVLEVAEPEPEPEPEAEPVAVVEPEPVVVPAPAEPEPEKRERRRKLRAAAPVAVVEPEPVAVVAPADKKRDRRRKLLPAVMLEDQPAPDPVVEISTAPTSRVRSLLLGVGIGTVVGIAAIALAFSIIAIPLYLIASTEPGSGLDRDLVRKGLFQVAIPFGFLAGATVGVLVGAWYARGGRLPVGHTSIHSTE